VIGRPTTAQILLDAAGELEQKVLPAVSDPAARTTVEMLVQIVRACSVRAAHEVAWMCAEEAHMVAYATEVAGAVDGRPEIAQALHAWQRDRTGGLELDEVVADYSLAGQAMTAAVDAALHDGLGDLAGRAQELLAERIRQEAQLTAGFTMPGRG
jgi:hypothetical protein